MEKSETLRSSRRPAGGDRSILSEGQTVELNSHLQHQQEEEVNKAEEELKKEEKDGETKERKGKDGVEKGEKVEENQGEMTKRMGMKEEQETKGMRGEKEQHEGAAETLPKDKNVHELCQDQSLQDRSPQNQPHEEQPSKEQPHQEEFPQKQPHEEQPSKEQPHQEEFPQKQPHKEQPSKEQPHEEQPSKEQPHQEQSPLKQPHPDQPPKDDGEDKGRLTVLIWNIDGLDPEDIRERVRGVCFTLQKYHPDVILLQELIPPYVQILQECFGNNYEFLRGNENGYFTGIMLKKCRVQLLQGDIVNYPTTEMGRNLLMAQVNFFEHKLCLMTSHLESCKESSQERLNQLRRVWKRMREAADDLTVIFGGDTNLRDWEVKKLGGLPDGISDVWELLGQPEDCRYTWDTTTNNNKDLPFPARLRFDRIFIRPTKEGPRLVPETMVLVGQKKLKCGRFPSDHWAILCTFSFKERQEGLAENSS